MPYRILFRRDTSANWESNNPILAQGEPGWETDTGLLKIGDGSTAWINLSYYDGPIGPIGPTGPIGSQGPIGPTGPLPDNYATTGSNEFYGDQTINGNLELDEGIYLNPQNFTANATVPNGYNGSLVGPIILTGTIIIEGNGTMSIL